MITTATTIRDAGVGRYPSSAVQKRCRELMGAEVHVTPAAMAWANSHPEGGDAAMMTAIHTVFKSKHKDLGGEVVIGTIKVAKVGITDVTLSAHWMDSQQQEIGYILSLNEVKSPLGPFKLSMLKKLLPDMTFVRKPARFR